MEVGCGNSIKFAHKKGNTVIDFGSGSGIDVLYLILQYFVGS
jgi:ribosomal protein L11 methylase PrmA